LLPAVEIFGMVEVTGHSAPETQKKRTGPGGLDHSGTETQGCRNRGRPLRHFACWRKPAGSLPDRPQISIISPSKWDAVDLALTHARRSEVDSLDAPGESLDVASIQLLDPEQFVGDTFEIVPQVLDHLRGGGLGARDQLKRGLLSVGAVRFRLDETDRQPN
jgi:hypothetical protein